ncbi:MAG: MerR family transcriptional regulator [Micrococcaceae bacterium]
MKIGAFAELTGVSAKSLRYYEDMDLIRPSRLANGYRDYAKEMAHRVQTIRELLSSGVPTRLIIEMIPCLDDPDKQMAEAADPELLGQLIEQRDRMTARIHVLRTHRDALSAFIERATDAASSAPARNP